LLLSDLSWQVDMHRTHLSNGHMALHFLIVAASTCLQKIVWVLSVLWTFFPASKNNKYLETLWCLKGK
jgi:hypothetical protein